MVSRRRTQYKLYWKAVFVDFGAAANLKWRRAPIIRNKGFTKLAKRRNTTRGIIDDAFYVPLRLTTSSSIQPSINISTYRYDAPHCSH
eukprot:scaffold137101_cov54-Attheya_sp.AAC.3